MQQNWEHKTQDQQFSIWRWPESVFIRLVLIGLASVVMISMLLSMTYFVILLSIVAAFLILWLANRFEYQEKQLQQLKHRMYALEYSLEQKLKDINLDNLVDPVDQNEAQDAKSSQIVQENIAENVFEKPPTLSSDIVENNPQFPDLENSYQAEKNTVKSADDYQVMTSLWRAALDWFKGGNSIVRIAVIILLIGVILLLRFASEYWQLTLSVKMGAIAGVGFAITGLGFWLRKKRFDYAVSLQGLGLGILYLVLFSSYHLNALSSITVAYVALLALLGLTLVLALKQNALILAFIALGSGFIAPFLLNTGAKDIPALMAYLFVLNAALAVIALFKPWRILNTIALLLTFGIGGFAIWQYALDAQKIQIAFWVWAIFALYLFISIRDGQQIAPIHQKIKNIPIVDTGLIFATPFMAFSLYAGLVDSDGYALSIASAVLSVLYIGVGYFLHRKFDQLSVLSQCFYGLGFVFFALILPFAFNAYWSSVGWAIHGIAMLYFGWKYQLTSAKYFGILLLLISGIASVYVEFIDHQPMVLAATIIMLLYAGAYYILRQTADLIEHKQQQFDDLLSNVFLVFSFVAAIYLYDHYTDVLRISSIDLSFPILVWFAVLTLVWWYKARKWTQQWQTIASLILSLTAFLSILCQTVLLQSLNLSELSQFEKIEFIGIGVLWIGIYIWAQKVHQLDGSINTNLWLHRIFSGIALIFLGLMGTLWASSQSVFFLSALLPMIVLLATLFMPPLSLWKVQWQANPVVVLIGTIWLVWVCLNATAAWQLAYISLLNPVDMMSIAVFGVIAYAIKPYLFSMEKSIQLLSAGVLLVLGLLLVSSVLLRTLYHYLGLPYWSYEALSNNTIQMSLTILWAVIALVLTLLASRKSWRYIWMMGIAVLGVVIAKLIFLDLSHSHTITRIISFIGSGVIMLVIGYFAPLPPKQKEMIEKDTLENEKTEA